MSSKFRYKDEVTNKEFTTEEPSFPARQGTAEPKKRIGTITGTLVNCRETADSKGTVKAMLRKGTKVEILNSGIEVSGYYHIRIKGVEKPLYVSSKFCKIG